MRKLRTAALLLAALMWMVQPALGATDKANWYNGTTQSNSDRIDSSGNFIVDDGATDSPYIKAQDSDDATWSVYKDSDGHSVMTNSDGEQRFLSSADADDYMLMKVTSNVPILATAGSCAMVLESSNGTITLRGVGGTYNEDLSINCEGDNVIAFTSSTGATTITFTGFTISLGSITLTTPLAVSSGGTGVATITDGGVIFGNGTAAVGNTGVLADGSIIIGDGATDPVTLAAFSSSTGTLKVANGGTGLASGTSGGVLAYTASGTLASSAALTANQLVIGGGAGVAPGPLGSLGTTTTLLHGNAGGAPSFSAVSLTADVSGILPIANGGTNVSSLAQYCVLVGGTSVGQLSPSATVGMPLLSQGASSNPAYTAIPLSTAGVVSGQLPVAYGGTGLASGTSGGILGFTDTGIITSSALLAANQLMLGGGAGVTPATLGSLGTTSTVLHGNAGGAPSFSAVSLTADVSGVLPLANGGTNAADISTAGPVFVSGSGMTSEANLDVTRGGTGVGTNTAYGVLCGAGTSDITAVAPSANTGAPLLSAGASANPAYGALNLAGGSNIVSGILPVANGGTGVSDLAGSGAVILNAGVMTSEATLGVARGGTGLASGTSGGILAYTADGTLASSALLTANAIMLGGGAGAAPSVVGSLGTTATVLHGNAGGAPSFSAVSLTADVSGILPVANGGTGVSDLAGDGALYLSSGVMTSEAQLSVSRGGSGAATFTDHGVLVGSGASAFTALSVGGANEILCGAAGADPGFRALVDADIPAALTLTGSTIENSPIGASTANTGRFTTCTVTSKFSGAEIENSGNVTIDAVNAGANSEVYIQNSADTYTANLNVDGDLSVSGHRPALVRTQRDVQFVDMDWAYAGAQGAQYLTNAKAGKVIHIPLDLAVGEELTGYALLGSLMATTNTSEVDCAVYSVTKNAGTPTPALASGTAMDHLDVGADTALDHGKTFAAITAAADTSYYLVVTVSTGADAGCKCYVTHAEYTVNAK